MKTIILFLLISINMPAQYLSKSKSFIINILTEQKTKFIQEDNYILITNISGCTCFFEFDKKDICYTETIAALNNSSLVALIADLEDKHYIQLNDVFFDEEKYGLVKVKRHDNIFEFTYE